MTIPTVGAIERRKIHLLGHRQHKPRKMILRQPLFQTRRQQQLLIPVTRQEVLGHTNIVLNTPDATPLRNSHRPELQSVGGRSAPRCPAPACTLSRSTSAVSLAAATLSLASPRAAT